MNRADLTKISKTETVSRLGVKQDNTRETYQYPDIILDYNKPVALYPGYGAVQLTTAQHTYVQNLFESLFSDAGVEFPGAENVKRLKIDIYKGRLIYLSKNERSVTIPEAIWDKVWAGLRLRFDTLPTDPPLYADYMAMISSEQQEEPA